MNDLKRAPVSVVIPCYRCAGTIEQAINSVLAQTTPVAEVILVDDCSEDDTLATLRLLRDKHGDWLKIIELPEDSGAATARNVGWAEATQPYIAFLDSDDAWHPKKIEVQYHFMAAHPGISLSGHAHRRLRNRSENLDWEPGDFSVEAISKLKILLSNRFITPSIMIKSDIPFRFSEGQRHMEDHLLWAKIICRGLTAVKLSSELAAIYKFPYGAGGLSSEYHKMHASEKENYRQLCRDGQISPMTSRLLSAYAALKFIKRLLFIGFMNIKKSTPKQKFEKMI